MYFYGHSLSPHLISKTMIKLISRLLFLTILIYSCNEKPKVDKELVYSALNDIIRQDSIFARIVCNKFDQVTIPGDILKDFFANDEGFIKEQLRISKNFMVDTGRLYFYSRRKAAFIKSFIDTTCSINIFYHFTYPVFSRDLQTVVVGVREDCNCMLGGWGFKAVYRRQKGTWVRIKKYDEWIS